MELGLEPRSGWQWSPGLSYGLCSLALTQPSLPAPRWSRHRVPGLCWAASSPEPAGGGVTSRSRRRHHRPPSRSWTQASPALSRPPQRPSGSCRGEDSGGGTLPRGQEEGARPDTPTRAHTPARPGAIVSPRPHPPPQWPGRWRLEGRGQPEGGAGRGGATAEGRALGRRRAEDARAAGRWDQRRPERARRVGPGLGRGSSPVRGSSVVPTPPTPPLTPERDLVGLYQLLPPTPSSMPKLSGLLSVLVLRLCPVLIFDPVPASLPQPHPPSVPPCPFAPSLPPLCSSPISILLSTSVPPPHSPTGSSLALLRGRAGGRPRRREGVRASGRAGPRPGGWAGVGSSSCLPLAGDPVGSAPTLYGAGSSSPPSLRQGEEREDPRDVQAGLGGGL